MFYKFCLQNYNFFSKKTVNLLKFNAVSVA